MKDEQRTSAICRASSMSLVWDRASVGTMTNSSNERRTSLMPVSGPKMVWAIGEARGATYMTKDSQLNQEYWCEGTLSDSRPCPSLPHRPSTPSAHLAHPCFPSTSNAQPWIPPRPQARQSTSRTTPSPHSSCRALPPPPARCRARVSPSQGALRTAGRRCVRSGESRGRGRGILGRGQ